MPILLQWILFLGYLVFLGVVAGQIQLPAA